MRKLSKILALVLVLMMVFSMIPVMTASAANISGGTVLYLVPSANWNQSNARFAAYFFGDGEAWVSMTKVEGQSNLYQVTSPAGKNFTNVIFCRMNPSASANNWNNKWNQTSDLTYNGTSNCYTVKEGTWDKGGGTWSTYGSTCMHTNLGEVATCTTPQLCLDCGDPVVSALGHTYNSAHLCTRCNGQATFTVAGSGAHLGTEWDTTNTANDMTYADGVYTKVYTNVAAGSYALKVARDHDWGTAYPSADKTYTVATAGSTVTVTLKGTTVTITVEAPHTCSFVDGKCSCGEIEPSFTVVETLEELKAALLNGGNILLNADIESSEILVIGQPTVLVGGGHTITSTAARAINISGADGVTVKNLTVVASGERAFNLIQSATNVTLENVTATAANYTVNIAGTAAGAVLTVKDSDLTGLNVVNLAASYLTVKVTGTKLTCNDQTDVEAYAAITINPEVTGTVVATNVEYVVLGDSSKIVNSSSSVNVSADDGVEVANMVAKIQYGDYFYTYATLEDAIAKAQAGDTIVLLTSIVIDEDMVVENVTIEASSDIYPAIRVVNGATVTMNNVTMTTGDYAVVLGASDGSSAGNLVINSGKYHGTTTVVSVTKGKLTVNGGEFSVTPYNDSYAYLLNCIDANYRDGSAAIEVLGGTFHNWNPANNAAEGANTNFMPADHHSVEAEGVYTVGAHTWVDATFEAPKTCTGCGATEGEALVAVAQVGDVKYVTLADALANGSEIVLLADIELDAPIVIAKDASYTIDLNGFTLSYTSEVMGEAMITNKGTLVINDSVGTGVINYNYVGANDASYGKGNYTISNGGTLTVNGGKITIANLRQHAKYPIDNNSTSGDAILVVNGGHLYNYNTSAIRMFCNSTTYKNSVTINGGLVEGYSAIWMQNPGKNTVHGALTITGGEIRTTAAAYVNGTATVKEVSSSLYTTIDGDGGAWTENSLVSITGGILNENVNVYYDAPANVTIGEATFNGNVWYVCNHVWVDATCTAPKTCSVCDEIEGEALGHTEAVDAAVAATCTATGLTEGKHCSVCNEVLVAQDEVSALGHDIVVDAAVDATCTATGLTAGEHCSRCDHKVAQEEVPALGHTFNDGPSCTVCGEENPDYVVPSAPEKEIFTADFNTVAANSSYTTRKTTNGWVGTNCAVMQGGTSDSNPTFKVFGSSSSVRAFTMNGKTSAKGSIVSPALTGGISAITFNYTNCFGESNGVDITITIKQNGTAVATKKLDNNSVTKLTAYTFTWEDINVKGDFTIEITNNSPSNSTSNKDRVSIWNLQWTNNPDAPAHTCNYEEEVTAPTCTEAGKIVLKCTICDNIKETIEGEAALGHLDENSDYKCERDGCGELVLPADGTALTITEALAIAKAAGTAYTSNKYYITGVINDVYNTTYGNMYIEDADGNEICIYGLYDATGKTRYDAMSYKPVVGDEVTVYTVLGMYNTTCQGKNAWLDEVVAHEHNEEVLASKDATCTATGLTEGKKCTICGAITVAQETVAALGHDIVVDAAVDATCTATGLTAGEHCSRCDHKVAQEEVPALGHDIVVDAAVDATCTATGLTAGEHCSRCDHKVAQEEVPTLGHDYKYDVCSACGEIDPAYASVTHRINFSTWEKFDKETYTDGTVVKYNDIFTFIYSKNAKVDGSNKSWDDFAGTLRYSFGSKTPTGKVPTKAALQITVDAAYTIKIWYVAGGDARYFALLDAEGTVLSETTKETVKNEPYYSELVIPAAGTYYLGTPGDNNYLFQIELVKHEHTYGEGVVTDPTCIAVGYTTYTCTICAHSYTDNEVAALGHTEEVLAAVGATCTATGLTEGKKCSVCNEVLTAQEEVPALGHTEEVLTAVGATCTATGLTEGKKCSVCNEVLAAQEEIPALGHTFVDGECSCGEKDPNAQPPVDDPVDPQPEPEMNLFQKIIAFLMELIQKIVAFFKK